MKKIVFMGMAIFCLVSCNNDGGTGYGVDIRKEALDSTLNKVSDSAKAKGERTLEAIKEKVKEIKVATDTLETDTIN